MSPDAKADDFYKHLLKDLSPTLIAAEKAEVQAHAWRLRKKFSEDSSRLHDYLRVRPIP